MRGITVSEIGGKLRNGHLSSQQLLGQSQNGLRHHPSEPRAVLVQVTLHRADRELARSRGNGVTIVAGEPGTVSLIAKPPGEWANERGEFLPEYPHSGARGGLLVAILVWKGSADDGLAAFAAHGGGTAAQAEITRRAAEKPLPQGWQPLWRVGETGMFWESGSDEGRKFITCQCRDDAAIA